ncbi:MAG: hypothetical protein H0T44_01445 [Gemmatimonadales bacterium]|nr:hypothetical protein [Gemmatimonadales bacterium]MDQ3427689.1 hypothetical protein [Gemmatimonadota bacterium]
MTRAAERTSRNLRGWGRGEFPRVCWRPGDERAELLADTLTWQPDPAVSPLEVDLPGYFVEVLGESPV